MINKYAEIYKRAQLYKAASYILRVKVAASLLTNLNGMTGPEIANAINKGLVDPTVAASWANNPNNREFAQGLKTPSKSTALVPVKPQSTALTVAKTPAANPAANKSFWNSLMHNKWLLPAALTASAAGAGAYYLYNRNRDGNARPMTPGVGVFGQAALDKFGQ